MGQVNRKVAVVVELINPINSERNILIESPNGKIFKFFKKIDQTASGIEHSHGTFAGRSAAAFFLLRRLI